MNSLVKKVLDKSNAMKIGNVFFKNNFMGFAQVTGAAKPKLPKPIKSTKAASNVTGNVQKKNASTKGVEARVEAVKPSSENVSAGATNPKPKLRSKSAKKPEAAKSVKIPKAKAKKASASAPKKAAAKTTASSLPFGLKAVNPKYLGKGLNPNEEVFITKCDMAQQNPFKDYINSDRMCQKSKEIIIRERNHLCYNYSPLPIVLQQGKGIYLQDIEGRVFIDFLSAYSAVNQGHNNTSIMNAAKEQMNKLYLTSRAFYNSYLYGAAEKVTKLFKYDKVLFMNGGVEAVESALKIARKWGYTRKHIPDNKARVIFAKGNFHGRTIAVCAGSDDKSRTNNFGPYGDMGYDIVEYNNIDAIRELIEKNPNYCAVLIEPIQGEHGVFIPSDEYLTKVSELCKKHNVLYISDEIQTGFGRAGTLLRTDIFSIKPDIVLLGKSLSGGIYPISAVLANNDVMDVIIPGDHGSTYGGNPLAMAIVDAAINEIIKNDFAMLRNCQLRGDELGLFLLHKTRKNRLVKEIRGRGLMCGLEFHPDAPINAYEVSLMLMERGLLCKPTGKNILRLSPPLIMTRDELWTACEIINDLLEKLEAHFPDYHSRSETVYNFKPPSPDAILALQQKTLVRTKDGKAVEVQTNSEGSETVRPAQLFL